MVKERGSDVIQMAEKGEDALLLFVVPNLDFVIITARYKEWLVLVKRNAADRTVVLVEFLDHCGHAVVPQLNDTAVKGGKDPWSLVMK